MGEEKHLMSILRVWKLFRIYYAEMSTEVSMRIELLPGVKGTYDKQMLT